MKFWEALGGTFLVATIVSISTVFFSTLAGYSFSKLRFRGRNALLMLVVATMTIPQQLSVVPLYIMANKAGLFGSLWAVIIPGLVSAFGVFWMTQYIGDALPYELIEAARVDGCSMFRTFLHVAIPAARPAAAMLFLFTFIAQWTNYFWPMLILGPNKNKMLTVAAATLKGAYFTDYTIVMSGVVLRHHGRCREGLIRSLLSFGRGADCLCTSASSISAIRRTSKMRGSPIFHVKHSRSVVGQRSGLPRVVCNMKHEPTCTLKVLNQSIDSRQRAKGTSCTRICRQ